MFTWQKGNMTSSELSGEGACALGSEQKGEVQLREAQSAEVRKDGLQGGGRRFDEASNLDDGDQDSPMRDANSMEGVKKRYTKKKKKKKSIFFPFLSEKSAKKKDWRDGNIISIFVFFLVLYIVRKGINDLQEMKEDATDGENYSGNDFTSSGRKKGGSSLKPYFSRNGDSENFPFEDDEFIYIPNRKSDNTIRLKNVAGTEIIDNNFLSVYSENMKYLRQTSLNYSLHQRALSTECYVYFRSFLKQAISPHSLTKAIKIDKEYIYPWDVITQDDVEKIIENAKFYGFLFTWFKNHRKAQKVDKVTLKREMPVLSPRFVERPDIYTHFFKKNNVKEPNFYGIHYTWLGHATGLVVVDGFKILVDPVFKIELLSLKGITRSLINWANVKIMGGLGERITRSPCNISNLPDDLHAVFVSHNHNDHIMEEDVRILCKLKKFQHVLWYVPEGTASFFMQEGCKAAKIFELSWGDERWISCWISHKQFKCKDGIWNSKNADKEVFKYKIIYAPTLHWSGRKDNLSDINHSLWGSLILKGPKHRFYFSGDTAYLKENFEEFKKIGRLHGPFHLAAIAIGAYEPNNSLKYHHVHPWESVKIWRDIKAEMAIGVHWGTFRLSAEEFMQPRDELEAALLGVGLNTLRNSILPFEKRKMEILKKYAIKNDYEEEEEVDDLKDLKEYFYPPTDENAHEYTDSFHSLFSKNMNLFYSDIDKNYVKHMYQQKRLYGSTYNRYKRAMFLRNSKKLPKSWKKLLLNLSIRFQTISIGGSMEVISKEDNTISMTRSTEYNAMQYEHYTFPKWYNDKEKEETLSQNSLSLEDLMDFHIVN
ncbi:conserved Plasmodium protein, unknown function [Plasmodium knowlesi strain H]|uniref:Metallo-beta-lactamase domain-containing protein n=3 Tax=Plasmodium knowlesi TaxID=5850 RepID=A0A5K1UNV5_PLAKH|nr:oocyst capsule protein Cap93, putative [Plasmodium knowlesi strain H]OTN65194.1 Uncharacterized protein PKNOH_S120160400 [Plasmodium knowlesi]CAA9988460.1 oocyst capsule protein Cap93, putative [Plasmodium knowlesi strain H]SBO19804.1 conserved Plasmodium protein, unknown function [Plasmodium knowlesi strain H]SBO20457.1 conserved Plasmodium protein, unknown function [Plasmodium knowlesi strain H]VVS77934.1 oocyst capsule protein Cap93, putative [Plasmodium knowlesi strain H]|eukprot:XP_002259441.1 hypothetical protein, conserved in Plasmodium species [Plasmodium knowlesi strain H]